MPLESNVNAQTDESSRGSVEQQFRTPASEQDPSAFKEADRFRADTYRILARLFRAAPDQDLIDLLADCSQPEHPGSCLESAWNGLAEACQKADPATVDDEFHVLFIGLGRGEVLPYASWYLSGFLLDRPLARLRSDLDALGIERAENVSESEDHVAAICETMALLVETEGGIDYTGQKQFFDQHLQPWFSQFLDDIRAAQAADFYRRVAALGQGFFEFEERWLSLPQ